MDKSDNEPQRDPESHSTERWWEFYVVRYATGTVVGGAIFYFLCLHIPELQGMLFGAKSKPLTSPVLALLAVYGLAYCYIASAPMLVFHAGRFLLNLGEKPNCVRPLIMFGPPIIFTGIGGYWLSASGDTLRYLISVIALAAFILWFQFLLIGVTLFQSRRQWNFYKQLAIRRRYAKGGITDSYRHLREHGNSFAIVILEFILAIILYTACIYVRPSAVVSMKWFVGIILSWTLPAALVWLAAIMFERRFMEPDPPPEGSQPALKND